MNPQNRRKSIDLTKKSILLLGGSGLLGGAILKALVHSGATVVTASRNPGTPDKLLNQTGSVQSDKIYTYSFNLADERSIQKLFEFTDDTVGELDGVVYNSVLRPMNSLRSSTETWNQSMRVNAGGYFTVTREAAKRMAAQRSGSIVAISSIHGMVGSQPRLYKDLEMGTVPDYFFHKAGMINFTRYMASVYGKDGVRLNCVSPGGIYNAAIPQDPEFLNRYAESTMLGRMADPEEITGAVLFLLSDLSSYITAANLVVDGGYTGM